MENSDVELVLTLWPLLVLNLDPNKMATYEPLGTPPPLRAEKHGLYHWLIHVRISRLIGLLLMFVVSVSLIAHYHISNLGTDTSANSVDHVHRTRSKLDHMEINLKPDDLRFRVEELRKIKASVTNELRELESRRQKLHAEMSGFNTLIEKLKAEYEKSHLELQQLKLTIENTKLEQQEIVKRNMPELHAPRRILAGLEDDVHVAPPGDWRYCRMHNCFDYSRCSLTSQFPVYFYDPEDYPLSPSHLDSFIKFSTSHALNSSPHMTFDPHIACIYVVLIGELEQAHKWNGTALTHALHSLPHWRGDGRNHLIINLARNYQNRDMFDTVDTGRAMLVQSAFTEFQYRSKFDLIIPPSLGIAHGDVWDQILPLVPAKRKHLLSFQGDYKTIEIFQGMFQNIPKGQLPKGGGRQQEAVNKLPGEHHQSEVKQSILHNNNKIGNDINVLGTYKDSSQHHKRNMVQQPLDSGPRIFHRNLQNVDAQDNYADTDLISQGGRVQALVLQERMIVDTLKRMQSLYSDDGFHFVFTCGGTERIFGVNGEWGLCGPTALRHEVLKQSTFSLIIAPTNDSVLTSVLTQVRLYEALREGAIPLILGDQVGMPFEEVLNWRDAVVMLPKARVTELHFVIRSFSDNDLLGMRRQGRHIWETYFGTTKSIMDMTLAVLRTRLHIAAFPQRDAPSVSVFNATFVPLREDVGEDALAEAEDVLGPIEAPYPSLRYTRNFTNLIPSFNRPGDPFHTYPFTPYEPVLPAEAKFQGTWKICNNFFFSQSRKILESAGIVRRHSTWFNDSV